MEYSRGAREVVEALRSVQESDETIWFDRALIAIADLFPTSALGFAISQQNVWPREHRRQVRADKAPHIRNGLYLVDLISAAEAAAAADGGRIVYEVHVAKALADSAQILQRLGISADALVARTEERESIAPAVPVAKRPRVVGAARLQVLDEAVAALDFAQLLSQDERTGTVERKRSILNNEGPALSAQELIAVALVNGSPEAPVYLIFGQEDDFTVVGEVDHRGSPLEPSTVRASQRRLDERLQACTPPIPIKWQELQSENKRVWIAYMLGRARGTPVRTTGGAYPYRSGEDTHYATPEQITAWLREPADVDFLPQVTLTDKPAATGRPMDSDEGRRQRAALSELNEAIDSFFQNSPSLPTSIRGRKLTDWQPVFDPILTHFHSAMDAVVHAAAQSTDSGLNRLARGLRSAFRLGQPRSGSTWLVEAPRLVTRLITDRLLVDAYGTERWSRLVSIGEPLFDSYVGRIPWVLAPEYRHPESLGRDASVANELSLREISRDSEHLRRAGLTDSRIQTAYAAVTVGLALGTMAREEASSMSARHPSWAMLQGVWPEIEVWEEEPELVSAFAALAGESSSTFRKALPERIKQIVAAFQSAGYWLDVPERVWASINRLSDGP